MDGIRQIRRESSLCSRTRLTRKLRHDFVYPRPGSPSPSGSRCLSTPSLRASSSMSFTGAGPGSSRESHPSLARASVSLTTMNRGRTNSLLDTLIAYAVTTGSYRTLLSPYLALT